MYILVPDEGHYVPIRWIIKMCQKLQGFYLLFFILYVSLTILRIWGTDPVFKRTLLTFPDLDHMTLSKVRNRERHVTVLSNCHAAWYKSGIHGRVI